ncbi:MAG: hypothetical protein SH856_01370 [Flavobacteriales bacterium]|nr:hypothetical protein [Flavobacteriales bacterium]
MKGKEKNLIGLSIGILAGWLFFSLYYASIRLYGDASGYLFQMINEDKFFVVHLRPVSFLTQLLPMLAMKMNASLRTIIILFSFNEWLLMACGYFVIAFSMKNKPMGLAMLLVFVIGSRWNYFNPVSELYLGVPFFFMLACVLTKAKRDVLYWLLFTALLVFTIFNHPLYSLLVPSLLGWFFLTGKRKIRSSFAEVGVSLLLIILHLRLLDDYDMRSFNPDEEQHSLTERIIGFNYMQWFTYCGVYLTGLLVLTAITFYVFWNEKRKRIALVFLTGVLAYTLMVLYKHGNDFSKTLEPFERYLFPLSIMVCMIFFSEKYYLKMRWTVWLVALVSCYHFIQLFLYGQKVEARYAQLERAIQYADAREIPKLVFRAENYLSQPFGHDWTFSYESLLLSSADDSKATRQVVILEYFPKNTIEQVKANEFIYAPDASSRKGIEQLNTRYFSMSASEFALANTDSINSIQPDEFFKNIKIEFAGAEKPDAKNRTYHLPIRIINSNSRPLFSGNKMERNELSYQFYDDNGEKLDHEKIFTPVFADVFDVVNQQINLRTPEHVTGDLQLQFVLMVGEKVVELGEAVRLKF